MAKDDPTMDIQSVISMDQILMIQKQVEKVYVDDNVLMYITRIIRKTRLDSSVKIGASSGGLALLKLSEQMLLWMEEIMLFR